MQVVDGGRVNVAIADLCRDQLGRPIAVDVVEGIVGRRPCCCVRPDQLEGGGIEGLIGGQGLSWLSRFWVLWWLGVLFWAGVRGSRTGRCLGLAFCWCC